ncbi:unnamed protein product [Leptosia nina]|uniref:acid phosphatase n=1 Tax=Leptosia nina TaxID=320188 RepID=A0AAV1JZN9_9NEOP
MLKIVTLLVLYFNNFGESTVLYAAVIYRHGDRTPVDTYPTDPWRNESLWPVKFGELTNIGKMQHYELGKWLRRRYVNLISEEFDPSTVYVRSTDVDRTLMSAQANLAGMYPPTAKSMWNQDIPWQPIPVHTIPENNDEVLAMKRKCKPYIEEKHKYINSKSYKERLSKYNDLMKYLTVNTLKKINDYEDIVSIYTTLKIETLYNFTLPPWTRKVFPEAMRDPACYSFQTATGTALMTRLMIGPLMQQIVNHMYDAVQEKPNHIKLSIYSGHDFTIGNILNGLGVYDGNCPEYTSTVFLELIGNGSDHYIRLSYRNSARIVEPYVLSLPNCGKLCPLQQFTKLYDNIISVDWEKECREGSPVSWFVEFYFILLLFLGILYAVSGILILKRRDKKLLRQSLASTQKRLFHQ